MSEIERILTDYLNNHDTKELAITFESYMESIGARKQDRRKKDNSNTYLIDGDSTNWNRVECYYHKDNDLKFGNEEFEIVMRKRAGYYLLIQSKGERPFETDGRRTLQYDEELMKEIVKKFSGFFAMLCNNDNPELLKGGSHE